MRVTFTCIILLITFIFLNGCSSVFTKLYGFHDPIQVNDEQIDKAINKLHIPPGNTFVLDSTFELFFREESKYNRQITHDHLQPLQVSIYNVKGDLVSFHINCYTSGLINLNWNLDGRFDTIPPKTAAPLDSTMNCQRHLSMILNYKTHLLSSDTFSEKYDYLFIVHWNIFWKRQSKRLVKLIENYKSTYSQHKIKIIYVNDDNLYGL